MQFLHLNLNWKLDSFLNDAINTVKLQTYTGYIEHIIIVDSPLIEVPKPSIFKNYSLNYLISIILIKYQIIKIA